MRNPEKFEPQFSEPEEEPAVEGPKTESEKDPEQESLRTEINRVNGIFGVFRFIDQERKKHRLDPLFELDYSSQYIKDLIPVHYPEDQKLTQKELQQTENKVLALTLEVADQILKKRELPKPARNSVRENPVLLQEISSILRKGELLSMNMQKERPQEVQELFKKILIERKGILKEEIKPEHFKQLADSIGSAASFISRKEKALGGYFSEKL